MRHEFKTKNVCSTKIAFDLEGDTVKNISFTGGCNGNLKAISILAEGMKADELIKKLSGNTCGYKNTSCTDQLAQAVKAAREIEKSKK